MAPHRNKIYLYLTQSWMRGVAILFAIGAVSGTVLGFELGLLFPEFMKHAGPIIGLPFSWEGTAFFLEGLFAGAPLFLKFVSDPVSLFCGFAAAALTLPLWKNLSKWPPWSSRIVVGVQFLLAGAGWCKIQYPFILPPSPAYGFEGLGFHNAAAPESTLKYLLIALGVGSGLIFPALIYLIKSLKLR